MRLFHKRAAKMHKAVLSPVNIQWTRQFLTFRRVIRAQDIVCIDEAGSEQFLARVCTAPRLPPRPCWRPRGSRVAFHAYLCFTTIGGREAQTYGRARGGQRAVRQQHASELAPRITFLNACDNSGAWHDVCVEIAGGQTITGWMVEQWLRYVDGLSPRRGHILLLQPCRIGANARKW